MAKRNKEEKIYGSYDSLKKENQYLREKIKLLASDESQTNLKENYLTHIFDSLPYMAVVFESTARDKHFHIRDLNHKAEKLFQNNREALLGKSADTICHSLHAEHFHQSMRKVLYSGEKQILHEYPFTGHKGGQMIISRINASLVSVSQYPVPKVHLTRKANGLSENAAPNLHITSDDRPSDQEGLAGYKKYKNLMSFAETAILEINDQGMIVEYNHKAGELLGSEQLQDKQLKEVPFLKNTGVPDRFRECLHRKTYIGGSLVIDHQEQQITLKYHFNPLKDEKGRTRGIIGIFDDCTHISDIEDKLRQSDKHYKELVKRLPEVVFETDREGNLLFTNDKAYDIFEYTEEDFIRGLNIFQCLHLRDQERARSNMTAVLEGQPSPGNEYTAVSKSGKLLPVLIYSTPVEKNGQISGLRGLLVTISRLKETESALEKAKDKAEQSDKLKSAFLANISHEIRTPMNGILGFAELLKAPDNTTEEREEYINIIQNNGNQLLSLINDIIDVAKIESGQVALHKKRFDLNAFMSELYHSFQKQYADQLKQIDFKLLPESPQQPVRIYTDPARIQQILSNLLVNAFKYTPGGSVKFGYKLNYLVNKKSYIQFFVADTGIGIDKKDFTAIFERFGQINKTGNNQTGTGLGLTISKNLVHLMGGRIWLDSIKGKGSTFYFIIPGEPHESEVEDLKEKETTLESGSSYKTILIVEDDIINQQYLQKLLGRNNINLISTNTGEKAIEIVSANPSIDLILMDIRLPGINGYETTKAIRHISSQIPIIAQTAYAMHNDHSKSLLMGCDDYISKPIDQNVLFAKLNDYLYPNKKQ
jgi:PAS domain S-box-containing protein